jgi:hypothetical protein
LHEISLMPGHAVADLNVGDTTEPDVLEPVTEERTHVFRRTFPRPSSMYPMARTDVEVRTEELPTVTAHRRCW